jgi:hypothetical protein
MNGKPDRDDWIAISPAMKNAIHMIKIKNIRPLSYPDYSFQMTPTYITS